MGGAPPLAMDLCGRQPAASEVAIARCTQRLAKVSLRECSVRAEASLGVSAACPQMPDAQKCASVACGSDAGQGVALHVRARK